MRPGARVFGTAVLAATALLVSCARSIHKNERYVLVATNVGIPYWQDVQTGFSDAGKLLRVKTEFRGPDKYDPEAELQVFQEAVASHPTGIAVSPGRPDIFTDAINAAIQEGIPVITVDSDDVKSRRVMFVGTDNYRAGLESGTQMATALHGRGHVVVVSIPGQSNQEERARGVQEAFKQYPFMSVGQVVNDNGDAGAARSLVAGLLQNHESIDGIICLEASGGPGVAGALDQAGMAGKIPVVAMDANHDTLDLISKGSIAATVAQKPYTMGFYSLRFLDDLHHNAVHEFPDWRTAPVSPLPTSVDTGTVVVSGRNLQDYLAAIPVSAH
ncbi:MAG TPA: substrate-binding domain-containing protein [Terriglobia bacterium]|nr:substrate-binding domain-containing protein [Terriglobia bacterium]